LPVVEEQSEARNVHGIRFYRVKEDPFMRRTRVAILATTGFAAAGALWLVPPAISTGEAAPPAAVTPKMQAPAEARALSKAFSGVARALRPSVVRLDVESDGPRVATNRERRGDRFRGDPDLRDFFERFFDFDGVPNQGPGRGTGSGFVMDSQGNIITNSHVIAGASKVTVILSDGSKLPARVIGKDELTDVAVVRLDSVRQGLVAARLGNSDQAEIGEWVLAVGSPLAMDQTVTAGIISGKGKLGKNPTLGMTMFGGKVREYLQTDAKINPGNSGGPLVNLEGEVIGVNTLINTGPGGAYGFAIPINQVRTVAESLIKDGRMRYAYLGIQMESLSEVEGPARDALPKNAPPAAVLVAEVTPGSPASRAGVRAGDIITRIDERKVEGPADISEHVTSKAIGTAVTLEYLRDGQSRNVKVTLGEFPTKSDGEVGQTEVQKEQIGVELQNLTPDIARFLNLPEGTQGVLITEVLPGSRAARAGLRAEDVILEVNRKEVRSPEEAITALRANGSGAQVLKIRRAGTTRFVTVPGR
jgi:serine protease Do